MTNSNRTFYQFDKDTLLPLLNDYRQWSGGNPEYEKLFKEVEEAHRTLLQYVREGKISNEQEKYLKWEIGEIRRRADYPQVRLSYIKSAILVLIVQADQREPAQLDKQQTSGVLSKLIMKLPGREGSVSPKPTPDRPPTPTVENPVTLLNQRLEETRAYAALISFDQVRKLQQPDRRANLLRTYRSTATRNHTTLLFYNCLFAETIESMSPLFVPG